MLVFCRLKKAYWSHHEAIGRTGAGLISDDYEGEITTGSKLDNIWCMLPINSVARHTEH